MSKHKDEETTSEPKAAPPRVQSFLDRLHVERDELRDRLGKLTSFLASVKFAEVEREEAERLKGQEIAMGHYLGILDARIAYHEQRSK